MRILTWNINGGALPLTTALAPVITGNAIDLCVLQEAASAGSPAYGPLAALPGYALHGPIVENDTITLPGGAKLAPADSQIRSYALVVNTATTALVGVPARLDYVADGATPVPSDPAKAADAGFNQRPPLVVGLTYMGNPKTVFTWHAPVGIWNPVGLRLFQASNAYTNSTAGGARAAIAGDLNVKSLAGIFTPFAGLQQTDGKLDYILANTALANFTEIPAVLQAGPHYALAAAVAGW